MRLLVKGMLECEEIVGEPYRYRVSSSRKGEPPYLVDLQARFPICRCTCRHYDCRLWPEFKKSLWAEHCKHVHSALLFHALRDIREHTPHLNNVDGE